MTMKDCISHLSEEIGARPVGTDEEQAAAFYIQEQFDQQKNLETEIQEFKCSMNPNIPRVAESVFCALSAIIAVVSSAFLIPCAIIAVLCGVLYILDYFDIFTLSTFLSNAPSQNVVAKYRPASGNSSSRTKKVVIITNYDSEKARPEHSTFKSIAKFLPYIELGGVALAILVMLLSLLAGSNAFFSFLLIVSAICCLVLPLLFVMQQIAPYNAAANCNAASVSVMLDVAEKLNNETIAPVTPRQYGRKAAEEAEVMPDGIEVEWKTEESKVISNDEESYPSEEFLSGETQSFDHIDVEEALHEAEISADREAISQALPDTDLISSLATETVPEPKLDSSSLEFTQATELSFRETPKKSSTPDWFTQAKKDAAANSSGEPVHADIKRSVFADALENANNPQTPENETVDTNNAKSDLEKQLEIIHAQINAEGAQAIKNNAEIADKAVKEVDALHDAAVAFENAPISEDSDSDVVLREVKKADNQKNKASVMPETVKADVKVSVPVHNSIFDSIPSVDDSKQDMPLADGCKSEQSDGATNDAAQIVVPATEDKTTVIEPISDATQKLAKNEVSSVVDVKGEPSDKAVTTNPEELSVPVINRARPKKREISLPSLTSAIEADKVAHELKKKTEAEIAKVKAESKNIKAEDEILPSGVVKHSGNDASNKMSSLGESLPSLNATTQVEKQVDSTVAVAGAFNVGDATGTFAPIGDELIAGKSESEIYVDDVDDSDYGTNITETGAMAGPEMVDIPGTRAESVFGKMFHRKKKSKSSETFSEGIGVDESFDAREVGKSRGDWSSFADDDEWEGGMFSKVKDKISKEVDEVADADTYDEYVAEGSSVVADNTTDEPVREHRRNTSFSELLAKSHISVEETADREEVYNFAVGAVQHEVWCVALGAENAGHAGLKAFINENGEDLKGATFIVLNGVGAGELSLVKGDGKFKKSGIPPRLKRYAKSAAKKLKIQINDFDLSGTETISSYLSDKGYLALHVAGIEDGQIAFDSTKEDTPEVVDELKLAECSEFVSQFLREI